MADSFFSKVHCDRCGKVLTVRTMSMFNKDVICPACKEAERKNPRYREACEAEHKALLDGNRNFEGIGL